MTQLPPEIFYLIIKKLFADPMLEYDIPQLALVSRLFLERARFYIFCRISLEEDKRCEQLCHLLARSPHLATYVQCLSMYSGTQPQASLVRRCGTPIASIISSVSPHLRSFALFERRKDSFDLLSTRLQGALSQLFRSPSLTSLHLHGISGLSAKYLASRPQLKILNIFHSKHVEPGSFMTSLLGADIQDDSTPICMDGLYLECSKCVESLGEETPYTLKRLLATYIRFQPLLSLISSSQQSLVSLDLVDRGTGDLLPPSTVHNLKHCDFPNLVSMSTRVPSTENLSSLEVIVYLIGAGEATVRALKQVHIYITLDDYLDGRLDRIKNMFEQLDASLSHPRYLNFEKVEITFMTDGYDPEEEGEEEGASLPYEVWFWSSLPLLRKSGRVNLIADGRVIIGKKEPYRRL